MLRHVVEQAAVHNLQALARDGDVYCVFSDFNIAKVQAVELVHHLIVITRNEDHMHVLARAAQYLLHHIVVGLRPVPALA